MSAGGARVTGPGCGRPPAECCRNTTPCCFCITENAKLPKGKRSGHVVCTEAQKPASLRFVVLSDEILAIPGHTRCPFDT
jgi:hypothetical protein